MSRAAVQLSGLPGIGRHVSSSASVTVTPGYSNADGAWVQLIAANASDSHWVTLMANFVFSSGVPLLVTADLAVGGAGSEVVIVEGIGVGGASPMVFFLPVFVPAGARLAVRLSSADGTRPTAPAITVRTNDRPVGDPRRSPNSLFSAGLSTNTGVDINAANTWIELTASTPVAAQALIDCRSINDSTTTATLQTMSVGIGASGGEVAVGVRTIIGSTSELGADAVTPIVTSIPAGSRISARASDGANNIWSAHVLLVPYT